MRVKHHLWMKLSRLSTLTLELSTTLLCSPSWMSENWARKRTDHHPRRWSRTILVKRPVGYWFDKKWQTYPKLKGIFLSRGHTKMRRNQVKCLSCPHFLLAERNKPKVEEAKNLKPLSKVDTIHHAIPNHLCMCLCVHTRCVLNLQSSSKSRPIKSPRDIGWPSTKSYYTTMHCIIEFLDSLDWTMNTLTHCHRALHEQSVEEGSLCSVSFRLQAYLVKLLECSNGSKKGTRSLQSGCNWRFYALDQVHCQPDLLELALVGPKMLELGFCFSPSWGKRNGERESIGSWPSRLNEELWSWIKRVMALWEKEKDQQSDVPKMERRFLAKKLIWIRKKRKEGQVHSH